VDRLNKNLHCALVGKHLDKGELFSFLLSGGSHNVMVFERKPNVKITAKVGVEYPIRQQFSGVEHQPRS
jgi:hypothetical protein